MFPPSEEIFHALELTPLDAVRVLILGQDPYHDDGQAHGLAFSVREGVPLPPSLRNIFRERESDIGMSPPSNGFLEAWAREGVLLLNTVLTVQAHKAGSHQRLGWEEFTDDVLRVVSAKRERVVFVLWGKPAQAKQALIDGSRHVILTAPHPSPLSAHRGFFGSRPFSRINESIVGPPLDWRLDSERRAK